MTTISYVNKFGGNQSTPLMNLARQIWDLCLRTITKLQLTYIASPFNPADRTNILQDVGTQVGSSFRRHVRTSSEPLASRIHDIGSTIQWPSDQRHDPVLDDLGTPIPMPSMEHPAGDRHQDPTRTSQRDSDHPVVAVRNLYPQVFMTFSCNDFAPDMLNAVKSLKPWDDPVMFTVHFQHKCYHFSNYHIRKGGARQAALGPESQAEGDPRSTLISRSALDIISLSTR